ncbi:MAG TPA: ATP-binding protein [Granulicella sp.]|nr:ATP-binding protein [Granulicella sp.]
MTFRLWLERAQCELLSGNFEKAEHLIGELLQRAASNVEFADVSCLKIQLHELKGERSQAVDSALTCLRLFGMDFPAHPTWEQVQTEYEAVWQTLNGRPIESLIDLPMMTDPDLQAAMHVLSVLASPSYYTDFHLWCVHLCRMVKVSIEHGMCGASAHAYGYWGFVLGPVFHRYSEGYRFGKLACNVVEKHGFVAYQAKVYHSMWLAAPWTQSVTTAINFTRATFRTATETGDLTIACYSIWQSVTGLLLRNDALDAVWLASEKSLDFVRKARFHDIADAIVTQQRFIATMQGRTATFSTFSDGQFDEAALTANRTATIRCFDWILQLKTRFLSGEHADALAAADKAKALLSAATGRIQLLDYFYYTALTVAALYEKASADEQNRWHDLLTAHCEQLREWAENYPPTFLDKHALVSAEMARIEGRDLVAMRLYEQAIQSAREHGFVEHEGLACEQAAGFYAERGFDAIAQMYLRNARHCYLRWGALGKVRQLEQLHPHLREEEPVRGPTSTIGTPVEHLDLATVMKVSQAVSGEIILERLIDTLMRTAIEHAGAERGLLILLQGGEQRLGAEATTGGDAIRVRLHEAPIAGAELPESLVQYVVRTQESVLLDDASAQNPFPADDTYLRQHHARSILCLPLINRGKLIGVLYLENNLTSHVFTAARIAVLKLLASQAAISLENARLYGDLQQREAKIRRLVDANIIGIFLWKAEGEIIEANEAFLSMVGYSREDLVSGRMRWTDLTPEEWREHDVRAVAKVKAAGTVQTFEKEYFRKDGSRVPVLVGAAIFEGSGNEGVAFVLDLSEQKRAAEILRTTQAELAHAARLTMMGELAASISHEINQPLAAIVTNGSTGLRWLNKDQPDVEEARNAFSRIISAGNRAGSVIRSLRALVKKVGPELAKFDINAAIEEVLALTRSELMQREVSVRTTLFPEQQMVIGDRVQLQQVLLNLVINANDAMSTITDRTKVLEIRGQITESGDALILVEDNGAGIDVVTAERIFEPFFTTKPTGMGMGLAICRSIIEAHGGRLWASPHSPHGTVFQFTVPTAEG